MIKEFVCPNGRMSVNGVCPIFEGNDRQIKDIQKKSTFDALKEDEIFGEKDVLEFDFESPTESAFKSASNIISNNISAYNNYVEDKLGIPAKTQNLFTAGLMLATGNPLPLITQFAFGGALRNSESARIQNITTQDPQGDVQTFPISTMNIKPSNRDIAMGGGSFNQPDGSGSYTGGFDSSTGNYSDPYDPGYAD
jgi:hypothetical protein